MPINVEHNVDPRLLGRAAYLAGQGQATQDALRTLSRYGTPQQETYHLGKLPQSGVARVSEQIANGELGGDNGLAQDMANRVADTGGSLYDPSLTPKLVQDTQANPNAPYFDANGTPTDANYGGAPGSGAAATAELDDGSQAREDAYRQRVKMIQNDDALDDKSKQYALRALATKHATDKNTNPYAYAASAQERFNSQLAKDPYGNHHLQNPDGSFTPLPPPEDPTPLNPNNDASMQPTPTDPSQPPDPVAEYDAAHGIVTDPVSGERGTWHTTKDGQSHFTPLKTEKKPATTVKDETWAQFSKDYDAAHKHLTKKSLDPDSPDVEPTDEEILNHLQKKRDAFKKATGRVAHADVPTLAAPTSGPGDEAPPASITAPSGRAALSGANDDDPHTQPVPPADAPVQAKAKAYGDALAILQSHANYQSAGPAGKGAMERQLHDAIFGGQ